MKFIWSLTLAVLMAACSSQPVKCHGPLRPINTTSGGGVGAKPAAMDPQP